MVLNKVRHRLEPILDSVGRNVSSAGVSPNLLTGFGFAFSILSGLLFATRPQQTYLAGIALLFSGLMDILDGSVARASKKVTRVGSVADSTFDRLSEIAIYSGIIIGGEASPLSVILAFGFSMLVSYLRAKGESINIKISGVGVGERAERLIVLIVFSLVGYVWIGIYIVLVLAVVTVFHRFYKIVGSPANPSKLPERA